MLDHPLFPQPLSLSTFLKILIFTLRVFFLIYPQQRLYVCQEYGYYTISKSQYHEYMYLTWVHIFSISIPWVKVYTMSQSLYNGSKSLPHFSVNRVQVSTTSSSLYHKSESLLWAQVYTRSPSAYHEGPRVAKGPLWVFN